MKRLPCVDNFTLKRTVLSNIVLFLSETMKNKMAIANVLLVGVLVGFGFGSGESYFVIAPNNTASVSGERLELQCRTAGGDSFVREWSVRRFLDQSRRKSESKLIFSHWKNVYTISPNFSYFAAMVDEFGSAVLYTNSSKIEDAGTYTCLVEANKTTTRYSAQVVILQTTPKCEATFKSDDFLAKEIRIWLRCTVAYRGNIAPVLQWRRHQHGSETGGEVITKGIQANTAAGPNISSTVDIVVSPTKNDIYYSCMIFFTSYEFSKSSYASMVADNAPEYSYTWTSPIVKSQSTTTDGLTVYAVESIHVPQAKESTNWYVISLALAAGMLGVFVLMAAITAVLCCRMKRITLKAEKRATVDAKSEEIQEKLVPKEASAQSINDDYDVIPNDRYERIDDILQEHNTFDVTSSGNQCPAQEPGYDDLLPPTQRESSAYFKIYHQNQAPVQYRKESIGPVVQGQAFYLDPQEYVCASESPAGATSNYLALVRDTENVIIEED